MIVMPMTHLESVDLNLLPPLAALLEEQHVTRAAERSGLSQPAMSRALGRLRLLLADPARVAPPAHLRRSAAELCCCLHPHWNSPAAPIVFPTGHFP